MVDHNAKGLSIYNAMLVVEGVEDASIEEQLSAWQQLVNTGTIWHLQGWYGRTAKLLIEQGLIQLHHKHA
jgi:hypothetical protein